MTLALPFGTSFINTTQALITDLETLRVLQERITQDANLFTAYLATPGARADLLVADLNNANSAITQMLFTFDSGSPAQKSFLFKLL